ncbi:MAG TPA: 2-hydroxy-3-oxopropionate reductase [Conexibacter sp.]|nr:2-hydroxy-3-oxopropionate reductase [Conexibacter sp.]
MSDTSTSARVAFVGLGIMGAPMARNLLAAGYPLTVCNRSQSPVDALVEAGAEAAATPAAAAATADVVITMLPDSPQVSEVVAGPDGVLEGARPGTLLIDMTSMSPIVARELAARAAEWGCAMLDAPVSGGDVGARDGTLSIMVGGDAAALERARPLLEVLGRTIVHVGEAGAGQVVKACNQLVVAQAIAAVSEALVLASKAGVEPARVLDVLSAGLAGNKVMEVRRRNLLEHDFTPGFKVDLHSKDLGIVQATARELGVPLPMTAVVTELFQAARVAGHGGADHSALLTVLERLADHQITPSPATSNQEEQA